MQVKFNASCLKFFNFQVVKNLIKDYLATRKEPKPSKTTSKTTKTAKPTVQSTLPNASPSGPIAISTASSTNGTSSRLFSVSFIFTEKSLMKFEMVKFIAITKTDKRNLNDKFPAVYKEWFSFQLNGSHFKFSTTFRPRMFKMFARKFAANQVIMQKVRLCDPI